MYSIRRKVKSLHHGVTEDYGEKLVLGFNHRDTEDTEKTHCLSLRLSTIARRATVEEAEGHACGVMAILLRGRPSTN